MKTSKWIKGIIMLIGATLIPMLITIFQNGGHPTGTDWKTMAESVAGVLIMYFIKPSQGDQDPWGKINWSDFWHGLSVVTGGFVVGTLFPVIFQHWPQTMSEWWIIIGTAVSAFGTYLLKALFTTSDGTVSASKA